MAQVKRTQNDFLPGLSDGLLFKDLINWSQVKVPANANSFPAVNILDQENYFGLELAAPGLKKDAFSIELENDVLSVSYLQKQSQKTGEEKTLYTLKEYSLKSFKRSFSLPKDQIDFEKIEAKYQDGILFITLPKKEDKKEKVKQIKIA